ncbi:pentapeptide repeat-containing protein [Streptomyces sp. NPDC055109]
MLATFAGPLVVSTPASAAEPLPGVTSSSPAAADSPIANRPSGVSLAGCDLTGADLREADLTGARFGQVRTGIPPHGLSNTTGIKLNRAILRGLELDQVIGWPITR